MCALVWEFICVGACVCLCAYVCVSVCVAVACKYVGERRPQQKKKREELYSAHNGHEI